MGITKPWLRGDVHRRAWVRMRVPSLSRTQRVAVQECSTFSRSTRDDLFLPVTFMGHRIIDRIHPLWLHTANRAGRGADGQAWVCPVSADWLGLVEHGLFNSQVSTEPVDTALEKVRLRDGLQTLAIYLTGSFVGVVIFGFIGGVKAVGLGISPSSTEEFDAFLAPFISSGLIAGFVVQAVLVLGFAMHKLRGPRRAAARSSTGIRATSASWIAVGVATGAFIFLGALATPPERLDMAGSSMPLRLQRCLCPALAVVRPSSSLPGGLLRL